MNQLGSCLNISKVSIYNIGGYNSVPLLCKPNTVLARACT